MNARTALSLVAAVLLVACSDPSEQPSTFEDSTTPTPAETPAAPVVSASPTEPAPAKVEAKVESCDFGKKTASGCEVTYEIGVDAATETLPKYCGGGFTAYNDCTGTPIEISWKDIGDRVPKSAKVEIGVSIFCADPLLDSTTPQRQGVSINGGTIGGFDGDLSACSCDAKTTAHSFDVTSAALEGYKSGGANSIKVAGPNRCIGVGGLENTRTVARIVVTY